MHLQLSHSPALLAAAIATAVSLPAQADDPAPYVFTTFAGASSIGSADGQGRAARFDGPSAVAVDGSGGLYVSDQLNHTIRRISAAGVVTTVAGQYGRSGSADGAGSGARFNQPGGLAVDGTGAVYVADSLNHTIRKITPAGAVTTIAGSPGVAGDSDGSGSSARFNRPGALAIGGDGTLYVTDSGNHTLRAVTPAGTVTTLAGAAGVPGAADGGASAARFRNPLGIAIGADGAIYIADAGNNAVRKFTAAGGVTTLAGPTSYFSAPTGIAVDASGAVYVADTGNAIIRQISATGVVSTIAGMSSLYFDDVIRFVPVTGCADGTGAGASFLAPGGLAIGAGGVLFVADTGNNSIRRIGPGAQVTTLAGLGFADSYGHVDAVGSAARFSQPEGVAVGLAGEVFVADYVVRRIDSSGSVTTVAATPQTGDGNFGAAAVTVDGGGYLYVADISTPAIQAISPSGILTRMTSATIFPRPGSPTSDLFYAPAGVAADRSGSIFALYATANDAIWQINLSGTPDVVAGDASYFLSPGTGYDRSGSADGTGSAARFNNPTGIAMGAGRILYVADTDNHTIRKVTPAGEVTTLAGRAGSAGTADGPGSEARFRFPEGVAVDRAGNVFVADTGNGTIRRITPAGVVTTVAGLAAAPGSADGVGAEVRFEAPAAIAVDDTGTVFVVSGFTVRRGQPAGPPVITLQPRSQAVAPGAEVLFSATATGVPAPSYQWYFRGQPLSGATAGSLTIHGAQAANAGDYAVAATNAAGTATSETASLTVTTASASGPPADAGGGGGMEPGFALALLALGAGRLAGRTRGCVLRSRV